jgi:hypothetical protein
MLKVKVGVLVQRFKHSYKVSAALLWRRNREKK